MAMFSGVQVATLLCGVLRSKFVALWIGAVGIGLFGIYNSALDMLATLCMLGIGGAAVRDIAAANTPAHTAKVVCIVMRWGRALSLLGGVLTVALSPWLNSLSFDGSSDNWWGFALLGIAVTASGMNSTYQAILQGRRQLKPLARASLWGIAAGLAVSLPLFWFFGQTSIPYSIAATALAITLATGLQIGPIDGPRPSWRETWLMGRSFVYLGMMMMLSAVASYGSAYAFMAWLNAAGGEESVGLFQAGQTIFNRYAGIIFMAISVEFFPRLASVSKSRLRTSLFCAHELKLVMLLMLPCAVALCAAAPLLTQLLYSSDFMPIVPMVILAAPGLIARSLGWVIAFPIVARGHGKILIFTESASALLYFLLNIAGWRLGGLMGLGVSYGVWYLLYCLSVGSIYRFLYRLRMPASLLWLSAGAFAYVAVAAAVTLLIPAGRWVAAAMAAVYIPFSVKALKQKSRSR